MISQTKSKSRTRINNALHFFLTKMIIGIGVIVGLVVIIELLRSFILDKTILSNNVKELIVAVAEVSVATVAYTVLFRVWDKRRIHELSAGKFINNASAGIIAGVGLQALFILIIYLVGTFLIININPFSTLMSPFAFSLTAGFVAEIIIVGIVFRLLEEQTGTAIALAILVIVFAVLHVNMKGATVITVAATAIQAGLMLPASYVYSRSLWLPIFLHFGWDFAEPGIFGGINPSTSLTQGLLTSKIAGNSLITGGEAGPQNSLTSLLACLLLGTTLLVFAKQKNNLVKPKWQRTTVNKKRLGSHIQSLPDR
jgi:membrane protease YdiL (CAAX protease family)